MPILKPIDNTYTCFVDPLTPSDVLKNIFDYNEMVYVETDQAGSQLRDLNPDDFFAVNRVLNYAPVAQNNRNKYTQVTYNCLLTIAKVIGHDLEVETVDVAGQFDTITRDLLTLAFINTFKSYFTCCDPLIISDIRLRPIWNSTVAVSSLNHSGVEITYNLTI